MSDATPAPVRMKSTRERRELGEHARAARLLELADAAAGRQDFAEALAWLGTFEASGHQLDPIYVSKREGWQSMMASARGQCSQWFG